MSGATVTVNGAPRPWRPQTLAERVAAEGVAPGHQGVAVARNAAVVPRTAWTETAVAAGDRIEIVRIVRGG